MLAMPGCVLGTNFMMSKGSYGQFLKQNTLLFQRVDSLFSLYKTEHKMNFKGRGWKMNFKWKQKPTEKQLNGVNKNIYISYVVLFKLELTSWFDSSGHMTH